MNSGKWLTVWSVCFLSQNCIAICYFTFACHHGKTLILFLSVFLSTALLITPCLEKIVVFKKSPVKVLSFES